MAEDRLKRISFAVIPASVLHGHTCRCFVASPEPPNRTATITPFDSITCYRFAGFGGTGVRIRRELGETFHKTALNGVEQLVCIDTSVQITTYKTVKDICNEYLVTRAAVINWITSSKLRALKVGNRYRVDYDDWKAFLEACNTK